MGYGQDGPYISHPAGADFSTPSGGVSPGQWRCVNLDTNGLIQLVAAQGVRTIGVLQDDPATGKAGTIKTRDTTKVLAGGTFGIGALLTTSADGRVEVAAAGDYIIGRALQAGVAGRKISMRFSFEGVL